MIATIAATIAAIAAAISIIFGHLVRKRLLESASSVVEASDRAVEAASLAIEMASAVCDSRADASARKSQDDTNL